MCALILVAKRFFAKRTIQCDRQSLQTIFENVVADALLDAIDGSFFTQRPGDQQERNVAPGRAQIGERVETGPAGQAVIGEHGIERAAGQGAMKFVARFD